MKTLKLSVPEILDQFENYPEIANTLAAMYYEYDATGTVKILDTHDNVDKPLVALIVFNNTNKGLAGYIIKENQLQCLTAAKYSEKDKSIKLSMFLIGGVLDNLSEEEILKYNESCIFEEGYINSVYFPDGTIWTDFDN